MSDHGRPGSPNMSGRRIFETSAGLTARVGKLTLPNRKPIETPTFLAVTSRGAIPHLTPDNLKKHTSIETVYVGLEDYLEKKDSPILQTPNGDGSSRLHSFTALPRQILTILGPRRCPAVTTPAGNTAKTISIFTSTGFRNVTVAEYASAAAALQPDIVLCMADLPHTSKTPASKKLMRMVEHTELWLDEFVHHSKGIINIPVFAPVLPVEYPVQWDYLRHLSEDALGTISGLAVYDTNLLPDLLANHPPAASLPKLSMDPPRGPHEVLRQIALGIDLCVVPFVNNASDAGVALTFSFPPGIGSEEGTRKEEQGTEPLGINMWSREHETSMAPLARGCRCYACSRHHRAYVQHLLNAKEMLGWNLLQMHNHAVVDDFFGGVRASLGKGAEQYEADRRRFAAAYETELPEGTGARPRARGYHFKSEAAQERMNKPAWTDLTKGQNGSATGNVVMNGGEEVDAVEDEGLV